jgi:predicted Rossmann-fold nucleotide-binding protein
VRKQLGYNNIAAELVSVELDGRSTGEAVLAAAEADGCDLLIKGAFNDCTRRAASCSASLRAEVKRTEIQTLPWLATKPLLHSSSSTRATRQLQGPPLLSKHFTSQSGFTKRHTADALVANRPRGNVTIDLRDGKSVTTFGKLIMIVGVMATGDDGTAKKHSSLAKTVGAVVARQGFHLLTGGGLGLMRVVGEEFLNIKPRTGRLISILRADGTAHLSGAWDEHGKLDRKKERPKPTKRIWRPNADNKLAEILIRTHLPYSGDLGDHDLSRNHINILTSDAVIFLPGGSGTFSELQLAWEYDKPILIFLGAYGSINGKAAQRIRAEFTDITVADTEHGLSEWLFEQTKVHPG